MDREKVIKKIKDLLRLAEGTNEPHEKASAERMVKDLMAKHNITASDLATGPTGRIIRIDIADELLQVMFANIITLVYKVKDTK